MEVDSRSGSPWGLMASHRYNVSKEEPKDGGDLIQSTMQKKKHLKYTKTWDDKVNRQSSYYIWPFR